MCLPQIKFVTNSWDGPARGLAEWDGEVYYFLREGTPENRRYSLRSLTIEQMAEVSAVQVMFQRYVGYHSTYVNGKAGKVHDVTQDEKRRFYDWHAQHPESFVPSDLPVVAYTDFKEYVGDE